MRRAAIGTAGLVLAGGGAAAGWLVATHDGSAEASSGTTPAAQLAVGHVERRTLTDHQTVSGTLGYGTERSIQARLSGTISWLPAEGATVKPGGPIMKVDGSPAILMNGTVPAYRALQSGITDGADVRQLEQGLAALGYDPGTVDAEWTASTTTAVEAWQEDLGLDETGIVELGRIVFLPGARRVSSREVEIGATVGSGGGDSGSDSGSGGGSGSGSGGSGGGSDSGSGGSGTDVLTTTSTRRVVTLDVDAADQGLAKLGAAVQVELPDGAKIPGRISDIGRVAQSSSDDSGGGGGGGGSDDSTSTITVTVKLTGRHTGGRLDQAPVSVALARATRKHVLAAPVTGLLAQRGGGYALDVIEGGRRRLVPVTPGLFADGYVEVRGDGLRDGTSIAVPAE